LICKKFSVSECVLSLVLWDEFFSCIDAVLLSSVFSNDEALENELLE
jgi:hypothetical protein